MSNTKPNETLLLAHVICRHLAVHADDNQLLNGLPTSQSALAPTLLPQALANVGIDAAQQQLPINKMALPALVIGNQGQAAMLISRGDNGLEIRHSNGCTETITAADFSQHYQKSSWYLCRQASLDDRAKEHSFNPHRHWLLQAFDEVKPFYASFLLGSFAINILAVVTPLFTMNVYDRVVPNQAIDTLWVLAIGASIAIMFDWLLRQARTKLADVAGKHIDISMSNLLFSRVLGMKLTHRPASAGAFAKQLQEFDSIREFITSATLVSAVDLPFTLLFLALIAWLGGPMVLVPLTCMVVLLIISFVMQKRLVTTIEQTSKYSTQRQAHLVETLNLLVETKQNNGEARAKRIWQDAVSHLADWQNESRIASNTLTHSVMNAQQLVTIGLIISGVYQIHAGNLSMGGLIAIVMLSGRAANAINQIAMLVLKYKQTQSAVVAVESILALPQENSQTLQANNQVSFNGEFRLSHASFSYPEQNMPAFNDIDLLVKPGERIGLFGAAGAGKSSLIAAIAGQYELSSGQISYNNLAASQWPAHRLRQHIGWMSQQPQLVYGSVLENLIFGLQHVDENQLAKTLMATGIDKLMARLGSGLESQVGEFGRQLSGGQRQAVALCRALLRQPKLLLLDEPTSAMDERAENQILACLKSQPRNCTMVIASHSPKVLSLCDRIIVMEAGNICDERTATDMQDSQKRRIKAVSINKRAPQQSSGGDS